MIYLTRIGLLIVAVALSLNSLSAATITGVTIEDVSSELAGFNRRAAYVVDGSGLNGLGQHTNVPDAFMWLSQGTFAAPNDPLPAQITFDLGAQYALNSMRVWNYNETGGSFNLRGVNQVELLAAESVGGPFVSVGMVNVPVANGAATYTGSNLNLAAFDLDNVRLLRFNILSNHGGDAQFAGLSEVQFDGALVPEPASFVAWIVLASVFTGAVFYRQRRLVR